jgi:regulator of protease activity HflC (stomatin/prohibitin superfamily)
MATRDRKLLVAIPGLLAVALWLLLAVAGAALLLVSATGGTSWDGVGTALLLGLLLLVALNGFMRRNLSLRIRNLDTNVLKVNDPNGNPIEISAVITWQVSDAAQAAFDVEDYKAFVDIQAETAVRHVASVFPYDSYEEGQESLRGAADRVISTLLADLQERLEVAADMLRRQQADAIVAARQRIVEGAVGMVLVSDRGAQPVVNSGSLYT